MSFYGYDPSRFSRSYGAEAVASISNILASAVQKYPELKQISENKVNNQVILQKYVEQFSNPSVVPDEVFTNAGMTREQFLSTLKGADTKKNNLEFANDLMKFTEPLKTELDKLSTQKKVTGIEQKVGQAMQPRYAEAPAATPRAVSDVSGLGLKTPEMPARYAAAPGAKTQAQIAQTTQLPYEQLKQSGQFMTAPSEQDIALQEYRKQRQSYLTGKVDLSRERLELDKFEAQLRERNLNRQTQKDINSISLDKIASYMTEIAQENDELKTLENPPKNLLGDVPEKDFDAIREKKRRLLELEQLIDKAKNLAKVTARVSEAPGLSHMSQEPGPGPGMSRPGETPITPPTRTTQSEWEQEGYKVRVR